jgi:hypothetical protein
MLCTQTGSGDRRCSAVYAVPLLNFMASLSAWQSGLHTTAVAVLSSISLTVFVRRMDSSVACFVTRCVFWGTLSDYAGRSIRRTESSPCMSCNNISAATCWMLSPAFKDRIKSTNISSTHAQAHSMPVKEQKSTCERQPWNRPILGRSDAWHLISSSRIPARSLSRWRSDVSLFRLPQILLPAATGSISLTTVPRTFSNIKMTAFAKWHSFARFSPRCLGKG